MPIPEMPLNCLENCVDEAHPKAYEDCTAGAFLDQRLKELGLKKIKWIQPFYFSLSPIRQSFLLGYPFFCAQKKDCPDAYCIPLCPLGHKPFFISTSC